MPRKQSEQDERLFPLKLSAAMASLAIMVGFFVITVTRGPNDVYTIVVGITAVVMAVLIGVVLYRRHNNRR